MPAYGVTVKSIELIFMSKLEPFAFSKPIYFKNPIWDISRDRPPETGAVSGHPTLSGTHNLWWQAL